MAPLAGIKPETEMSGQGRQQPTFGGARAFRAGSKLKTAVSDYGYVKAEICAAE